MKSAQSESCGCIKGFSTTTVVNAAHTATVRGRDPSVDNVCSGVKTGNTRCEQMFSALPLKADIAEYGRHVRFVPILLKKSFLAGEQNFSGPLMRSARGDVRDHIVLHKNDHEPSYRA
jgi:hypothetical protein